MTTLEIDCVSQRNNFITVSDFSVITPNTIGVYSAKSVFEWRMMEDSPEEWIKINAITSVDITSFSVAFTGFCTKVIVETSYDDFNWTEIFNDPIVSSDYFTGLTGSFKFIRFRFVDIVAPFLVSKLSVKINDSYENDDFISFHSETFIPLKMREKNPLIEDFVKTYLEMLEDNTIHDRRLISSEYFMNSFNDIESSSLFAIDSKAVNVHPIDGLNQYQVPEGGTSADVPVPSMSSRTNASLTINWNRVFGTGVLVIARLSTTESSGPSNGVFSYSANSVFGAGTEIGPANFVVYKGTGQTVTITGLDADTIYEVDVFQYADNAGEVTYVNPGQMGSFSTLA